MLISGTLPRSVQAGVKENLGHKEEYEENNSQKQWRIASLCFWYEDGRCFCRERLAIRREWNYL